MTYLEKASGQGGNMYTQAEIDEQVRKVEQIRKEINRKVKEERLEVYNVGKVHDKQVAFHQSSKRMKAFFGGNRVGKTTAGAVEVVCHALGYSRFRELKPSSGWVVSFSGDVQKEVAQKEILRWLPKREISNIIVRHGRKDDLEGSLIEKIILKNGQSIGFKTCEQGRESFQGASLGWVYFDEEPPLDIYQECQMRVLDTEGDIWFTMTPLKGLTWIYNLIYLNDRDDPDIEYWMAEWEDNPWLSKVEIDKLILKIPEEEREARQFGRFTSVCGFMFNELKREIHIKEKQEVPDWYRRYVSIDYGLDATAVIWYYVDAQSRARIYRIFQKSNLIISEACNEIIRLSGNEKIEEYLAPPDLWARSQESGKSRADIFYENGIYLRSTSNDRVDGWANVKEWLKPYTVRDEITGNEYKTANLTLDVGVDITLWKCLTTIQRDIKNSNDVSTQPHNITHLPDSLRCFCVNFPCQSIDPALRKIDIEFLGENYDETELEDKGYSKYEIKQYMGRHHSNTMRF
jgi:phage terminase large subunit